MSNFTWTKKEGLKLLGIYVDDSSASLGFYKYVLSLSWKDNSNNKNKMLVSSEKFSIILSSNAFNLYLVKGRYYYGLGLPFLIACLHTEKMRVS